MGTAPLSVRVVTQLAGGGAPPQQLPSTSSATRRAPAAAGPGHLESSPSSFITASVSSPLRKERANRLFPKTSIVTGGHRQYVGLASLLSTRVEHGADYQRLLTCVYAVSQRDFSFEFRLRDYFFLGRSPSKGIRVYTLPILDSAMRLEKAAPPRTPEQLAELGKYSGRSLQAG